MTAQELATIHVRPLLLLTAFQWDGTPVDGWDMREGKLVVPCYEGPREASAGDWISLSPKGVPMVWSPLDFVNTYEIVRIRMSLWGRLSCFLGRHALWHKHEGADFWTICRRSKRSSG